MLNLTPLARIHIFLPVGFLLPHCLTKPFILSQYSLLALVQQLPTLFPLAFVAAVFPGGTPLLPTLSLIAVNTLSAPSRANFRPGPAWLCLSMLQAHILHLQICCFVFFSLTFCCLSKYWALWSRWLSS